MRPHWCHAAVVVIPFGDHRSHQHQGGLPCIYGCHIATAVCNAAWSCACRGGVVQGGGRHEDDGHQA